MYLELKATVSGSSVKSETRDTEADLNIMSIDMMSIGNSNSRWAGNPNMIA